MKDPKDILRLYLPIKVVATWTPDEQEMYYPAEEGSHIIKTLSDKELCSKVNYLNEGLAEIYNFETERKLAEFLVDSDLKEKIHSYHLEFEELDGIVQAVAIAEIYELLNIKELVAFRDEIISNEAEKLDFFDCIADEVSVRFIAQSDEINMQLYPIEDQGLGMTDLT